MKHGAFVGLLAVVAAAGLGCSSEAGGPRYVALGIHVTSADLRELGTSCTRLPVLLGSRVLDRIDVDGRFEIVVRADRDGVKVEFPGAEDAEDLSRAFSVSKLEGSFSEMLEVEARDRAYLTTLSAGCTADESED